MTAFNEYDGIPASGNRYLLTDVLRDKWGFKGFVVTDYTSINEMVPHGYAKDLQQAGEQAINAGVDMDLPGAVFMKYRAQSIAGGQVDVAHIDAAVKALLEMQYRLDAFGDPSRPSHAESEERNVSHHNCPEAPGPAGTT